MGLPPCIGVVRRDGCLPDCQRGRHHLDWVLRWRPTLYAFLVWGGALGCSQVLKYGETGKQTLFVLPAILFTAAMVIFPTLFGLYIAFTDWNLNAESGHHFNGLNNLRTLWADSYFWNALGNMVFYVGTVIVQYVIAFGLALLINADIRGRKFFRVAFLLPFMLSPVAVSWMIGKSLMENRFGPLANFADSSAGKIRPSSPIPGSPEPPLRLWTAGSGFRSW